MKLLVFAQTPPPVHGQSLMVQTMVEGLPRHGIALHHVNLRLSSDQADIGRWRAGKVPALLGACIQAVVARFRHRCDTLYYVPAPGKRGALYRDWLVMLLCRPFFRRLVLHWHAAGLGEWLRSRATMPEQWLSRRLLGRADLSIVLSESLRNDAGALAAKRVAVVPNGIADPCPGFSGRKPASDGPFQVLFLGLCAKEKGLFDAAQAVFDANQRAGTNAFHLTVAGAFPDSAAERRFAELERGNASAIHHAGFVSGEAKHALLRQSDCLCLPTRYPHEGQPLVLLEALAHDLPVVASRWRGIPEMLPPEGSRLAAPGDVAALADALLALRAQPPAPGICRARYLRHFTRERHLSVLAEGFRNLT